MELDTVDSRAIAERVVEQEKSGLNGREVDFELGSLPQVRSDPVLLGQVYANLIGNAVKFSRPVAAAKIEIGSTESEGEPPVFHVRDNGVGFDMAFADKLFGVFQRLHPADDYEGTGAGLAIVQRIVHRHGGRIWADSQPGNGAAFYFTLSGETSAAG